MALAPINEGDSGVATRFKMNEIIDAVGADAVFSSSYSTVEAAHGAALSEGKARVIINQAWSLTANFTATLPLVFVRGIVPTCGAFTLTLSGGFEADDTQKVFNAADAPRIFLPAWQRLTPFHFGARADFVSSGTPGTDDADALNAWASKLCSRVMPAGNYGVTKTIFWNGDETALVDKGMWVETGATIFQRTDNIPILTFHGSRGKWAFPALEYVNLQPETNFGAVAAMVTAKPGTTGFYQNSVLDLHVRGGPAVGLFIPPAISSTLAVAASGGATSITVTNAQTNGLGTHPWQIGMWVQIRLDAGTWFTTRIMSVAGAVLGLKDTLPSAAALSARVIVSVGVAVGASDAPVETFMFSNFVGLLTIDRPSHVGLCGRGGGTGDVWQHVYVRAPGNTGDITAPFSTCDFAVYMLGQNAGTIQQLNLEYVGVRKDAVFVSGDYFRIDVIHFEGCKFSSTDVNGTGVISGTVQNLDIGLLQIEYLVAMVGDLTASVGLLFPRRTVGTSLNGSRGTWSVKHLITKKNVVSVGSNRRIHLTRGLTNHSVSVKIDTWTYERDGGIYPQGQLSAGSTTAVPVKIGNLLPVDCVAFLFGLNANNNSTYFPVYAFSNGRYQIDRVDLINPSTSMTAATLGLFEDNSGSVLISNVNNESLAPLTGAGTRVNMPLAAAEANKLRGAANLFAKLAANQALPTAVVTGDGGTSQLTGRGGGNNNTNLAFITFAAPHGFIVGNIVNVTGSGNAAINGTSQKIVDVPSTTQIVLYVDSAAAVSVVADVAVSVQLQPTIDIVVRGAMHAAETAR